MAIAKKATEPEDPEVAEEAGGEATVWSALSALRVFEDGHVHKKGRFAYLKWQAAWRLAKDLYPGVTYTFQQYLRPDGVGQSDVMYYADMTASVTCTVCIPNASSPLVGDSLTHTYPVLNHNNNSIKNPGSFDINTARMRALVKTLAMLGLGLHVYEGYEDDSPLDDAPKPGLEAVEQGGEDAYGVDGFIDCMYSLGVKISDVHDFVKKQRDSKLNDLSPGDLKTLQDFIVNAEKADNNWRV